MNKKNYNRHDLNSLVIILCMFLLGCSANNAEKKYEEAVPDTSSTPKDTSVNAKPKTDVGNVTVGAFTLKVPTEWRNFNGSEMASLREQYMAQSDEIYRQYSGSDDPVKTVDISAFHITDHTGTFAIVSFTVPPQANLILLLKSQADDKAAWGIREGYIRKYLGLVPIDNEQFSGFYTKASGNSGEVQISGGLEHKKLKNTILQLTLLCPKAWDEDKATNVIASILESVMLKAK